MAERKLIYAKTDASMLRATIRPRRAGSRSDLAVLVPELDYDIGIPCSRAEIIVDANELPTLRIELPLAFVDVVIEKP